MGSTGGGGGGGGCGSLGKMAKNCMKITNSAFLGQNSGGEGDKPIFRVVGGDPPSPPPLGETLHFRKTVHN